MSVRSPATLFGDSMAAMSGGCRFYTSCQLAELGSDDSARIRAQTHAGIQFVEMRLKPLFVFLGKAGKFDAHPNARITGAYHSAWRDLLFGKPEIDSKSGADSQGHHGFNITTIAADIGSIDAQRSIHSFIAQFQREGDFVSCEFSAVVLPNGRAFLNLHFGWQSRYPWTILFQDQLNADLGFLKCARIDDPHHLAACLLAFILHADDVANLQLGLDAVNARTGSADVLGNGILEEWLVVAAHSPHLNLQVQSRTWR